MNFCAGALQVPKTTEIGTLEGCFWWGTAQTARFRAI